MKKSEVKTIITIKEVEQMFASNKIKGFKDKAGKRYILFKNSSGTLSFRKGRSLRLGYLLTDNHLKDFSKYIKK